MHCDHAQKQLNALIDGELNRWQTGRIQRHLRRCADCTAELAQIEQLSEQARMWREASAPASLESRILQALRQPEAEGSLLSSSNEENTIMHTDTRAAVLSGASKNTLHSSLRRIEWRNYSRPIAALAGVGIMFAVMALFLMPSRKSFAFTDVLSAMQKIRTVHWSVKSSGFAPAGFGQVLEKQDTLTVMEAWARLDKPAYAIGFGGGSDVKMLILPNRSVMAAGGKAVTELPSFLEGLGADKESALRTFILAQLTSPSGEALAGAKNEKAPDLVSNPASNGTFQSEEVILDGRRVVRFYSVSKSEGWHFELSLWVDPDTRLIIRSESRMSNPIQGQPDVVTIAAQFRYNEEPPAGIFDEPAKQQ